MTHFIIFVLLLLTGRLVHGVTENVKFFYVGDLADLRTNLTEKNETVKKCILETNQGEVLDYNPANYDIIRDDIELIDSDTCSIRIYRINNTHAGIWKITTYIVQNHEDEKKISNQNGDSKEEVFMFHLHVRQTKKAVPSQYIEAYDGHYISMKHIENYENLTACNLTGPMTESINLLTEKQDGFQLFGQCGVRMKVNATYEGSWALHAIVDDYMHYEISFLVDVHQLKKEDPDDMMVMQWTRGSSGIISLPDVRKICQIVAPNGVIVATSLNRCYHVVKVATIQHEGVWLARYNMYGMLEPIEQKFRVETFDQVIFNTSVSYVEDGSIKLLCQLELKDARTPESCSFIRPDGKTLYMTPAIGNERYSAYINFDTKHGYMYKVLECGIRIRKFEDVDYGAWRCDLTMPYNPRHFGSVLHVDYPDSREDGNVKVRTVKIKADQVHVKRGDPFTIKCIADSALKYCWLRSPNGTSYSITQDKEVETPFVLPYEGQGLWFGECGAKISAAVDSDNGHWSCLTGVVDGDEESTTVSVTVTETYLVAEQTEIAVSARNDPVLSCHILPRMLDRTVHYCRWIRPDGYGIYNDISHRYTTSSSYSQCRLVILNYCPEEDNGNWTCVAGLKGENGRIEEAWDHVRVQEMFRGTVYLGSSSVTILAIVITLVILIGGIAGFIFGNRHRFRRSLPENPPTYSPQHYPPKFKFDVKEAQY
ncbi:uncharacterized protein LOC105278577 [Ooceraea biroi]|uniref:uncharacterized protein LOC105278577 n=1 Tax=Ooceraea biroi TaxID=2015173 RepID=UPI000F08D21B|nr:uncharacterized protein LOC105278577 [Ooceraea biroi]